jgi:hypothetical protein
MRTFGHAINHSTKRIRSVARIDQPPQVWAAFKMPQQSAKRIQSQAGLLLKISGGGQLFMVENCIPRDRIARWNSGPTFLQPLDFSGPWPLHFLQRLPFSSACHSPATTTLQRLPFSNAYHSPVPTNLQRLPFSSACRSPAPTILQRLPFSSDCHSLAPTIP